MNTFFLTLFIGFLFLFSKKSTLQNIYQTQHLKSSVFNNTHLKLEFDKCIPDSNLFYLKRIKKTIKADNLTLLKKLTPINQIQTDAWIVPIKGKIEAGDFIRLVSFQGKTENYYAFILLVMYDIGSDLDGIDLVMCDQYFVTIDKRGKFISSLKVFDNFRTDDRDDVNPENNFDKEIGSYKVFNNINAEFIGDTILLHEFTGFKRDWKSKQKENRWEGTFVTFYSINKDGKIECIKSRAKVK